MHRTAVMRLHISVVAVLGLACGASPAAPMPTTSTGAPAVRYLAVTVKTGTDGFELDQSAHGDLGLISMDSVGRFAFVSVQHGDRAMLEKLVARLNSASYDVVHVDVACPEGSHKFEDCSRPTSRGTAGYLDAIVHHVDTYDHLDLLPIDHR